MQSFRPKLQRAAKRLVDLQLEHDCGYNCAAFSLFHQKLPFLAFPKGGVALLFCVGYRGCMWFFYDRHAHRRVNKRRSA